MTKPQIIDTIQDTAKTVATSPTTKLIAGVVVAGATIVAVHLIQKKIEASGE